MKKKKIIDKILKFLEKERDALDNRLCYEEVVNPQEMQRLSTLNGRIWGIYTTKRLMDKEG